MSSFEQFRCDVERAVTLAANDTRVVVQWEDDAQCMADDLILLTIVSQVPTYNREEEIEVDGEIVQDFSTMMTITVQVAAESSHAPSAGTLAERVRINLRRFSIREELRAKEISFVTWPGPVRPLGYTSDGRHIHKHLFEVRFNTVFTFDELCETIPEITELSGSGELDNGDGDLTAVPISVTAP